MSFYIICPSNTIQEKEQKKLVLVETELKSINADLDDTARTIENLMNEEAEQYIRITRLNEKLKSVKEDKEKNDIISDLVSNQEKLN